MLNWWTTHPLYPWPALSLNRKYLGPSRGITWYNFLSDQFSGFHGIVVPGTLRDSIFVLEGLLERQTGLNPVEIMTDTAGASDIVFGLFWLLGYQFSPRPADAGESVGAWIKNPDLEETDLESLSVPLDFKPIRVPFRSDDRRAPFSIVMVVENPLWIKWIAGFVRFNKAISPILIPLLKLFKKYKTSIAHYFKDRKNSGFVEGLNNKIKVAKRRYYGFTKTASLLQRLILDLQGFQMLGIHLTNRKHYPVAWY